MDATLDASSASDTSASVTVFVCEACGADTGDALSGKKLLAALQARNDSASRVTVTGVDCLAVCERPVTVAFAAEGKWTYIIGDVDPDCDADDVLAAAKAVGDSPYGVPAMVDRPEFFRRGVVSRTPPPGWEMPQ